MNPRPLFFFSLILFSTCCSAQDWTWQPANGPYGGPVLSLVMDRSGRLFAGTETKGVFLSTDQGESWQQSGLTSNRITALAVDSTGAVLAATSNSIYRSTDGGYDWKSILLPGMSVVPHCLSVTPEGTIIAGTQTAVLWSTNTGTNWATWNRTSTRINGIAVSPAGTWIAATGGGMLRSTNKGMIWTKTDSVFGGTSLSVTPSGRMYAGTELKGVYVTVDDGVTWISSALKGGHNVKSVVGTQGDTLFAAVFYLDPSIAGGIWRSVDAGATWSQWGLGHLGASCIIPDGHAGLIAGTMYGLFRSADADSVWREINAGLTNVTVKVLKAVSTDEILAGTTIGLFYSSDHGGHWVNRLPGLVPGSIDAISTDTGGRLYFSTMLFSPLGGIFRSTDQGVHWTHVSGTAITGMYESIGGIVQGPQGFLFAGTSTGRIFRSGDAGDSWLRVDSAKSCGTIRALAADSAGRIFVGSWGKGVFRSTDDGMSWVKADSGIAIKSIGCLAARGSSWIFAGGSAGIYRSSNTGNSWATLTTGVSGRVDAVSITGDGDLLASIAGRVLRSTDNGDSWIPDASGLPAASRWVLATTSDATVYAGSDTNAVFLFRDPSLDVSSRVSGTPSRVTLHQNYPNPFNPSTTIRFAVPVRTVVQLTVWNMLGQRVAVLQDGDLDAGQHETILDARGLASGVYFYRIQAGSFTETKRLLLLR